MLPAGRVHLHGMSHLCPDPSTASVGSRHGVAALGQVLQGTLEWRQITEIQGQSHEKNGRTRGDPRVGLLQGGAGLWVQEPLG